MSKVTGSKFYQYHGIFSEINKLRASICLQRAWRLCRYDPHYIMCDRVITTTINSINMDYNFKVSIDETTYNINRLKQKQKIFKAEVEKTRKYLINRKIYY
jgi:hypothetical protein